MPLESTDKHRPRVAQVRWADSSGTENAKPHPHQMDSVSRYSTKKEEIPSSTNFSASSVIQPDKAAAIVAVLESSHIVADAIWPSWANPGDLAEEDRGPRNEVLADTLDKASHLDSRIVAPAVDITRGMNGADDLDSLAIYWMKRCEVSSKVEDIDHAIEYFYRAVVLTPEGHASGRGRLNNLGVSHQRRFVRLGDLADIEGAIACQSQAVLLTPDGHSDKPGWLNNLGSLHQSRFKRLGDLADIDRAIACHSHALLLTPDGHADKPAWLSNLGNSHQSRFKHLGDLADIDRAITCHSQA
ncbi:hypothetical protein BDV93DRAFT_565326, partial [Ceratobasidium sp. AG-I]